VTSAHRRGRAFEDLARDDIEHRVDLASLLQSVGLQVCEGVRAQPPRSLPVRGTSGADHAGAQLAGELHRDQPDAARGAVDQDGLARLEVSVVEQALPGGQPGDGHGGGHAARTPRLGA
jgi:hypothetical protein